MSVRSQPEKIHIEQRPSRIEARRAVEGFELAFVSGRGRFRVDTFGRNRMDVGGQRSARATAMLPAPCGSYSTGHRAIRIARRPRTNAFATRGMHCDRSVRPDVHRVVVGSNRPRGKQKIHRSCSSPIRSIHSATRRDRASGSARISSLASVGLVIRGAPWSAGAGPRE